jgi:dTDP-4-dehydrorhamnose reductase
VAAEPTRWDALVVGGDGLVGGELVASLRHSGRRVRVTSRRPRPEALPLDLAEPDLEILGRERFDYAFICAGVTGMQRCEQHPEAARQVNVHGTLSVMRALAAAGTHLVFLSSGQVFDGETRLPDETTPCRPRNVYGRLKFEAENEIARERLPASILRPTKILGSQPVGMFRTWYDALRIGGPAIAASNMTIAPVSLKDVAQAAIMLATGRRTGVWHLSSSDEVPYDAAALRMADLCGFPQSLVRAQEVTEAEVPAIYRPRYAALASGRLAALPFPIRSAATVLAALFSTYNQREGTAGGADA